MHKLRYFAFGFAWGIFWAQYLVPLELMPWLGLACAVLGAVLGLCVRRARGPVIAAAVGIGLGLVWCFGYDTLIFSHAREYDGTERRVEALVQDFPVDKDYGSYVDVKLRVEGKPDLKGRAYVFDESADSLRPGDLVRFTAEISTADKVGDNEITSYTSKGYFLFLRGAKEIEVLDSPGAGITNFHRYLAKAIKDKIRQIFPLNTEGFMLALLTGDRSLLDADEALTATLERAGVSHIIAISGMHVSILAGFVLTAFRKRRWAVFAVMPVLMVFMGVSGFSASVVRAVIMQGFLLAGPLLDRESDSLTSLSVALLVLLAVNPYAAAGVGLQLSFAATLGIVLFTPRLNSALGKLLPKRRGGARRAGMYVLGGISTTLGALAFTAPITAYYFGTVSLIAPLSNLLVLWAVTPAFVFGVIAVAAGFVYVPAGTVIAYIPAVLVKYIELAVRLCAKPFLAAVFLEGTAVKALFVLAYSALLILMAARAGFRMYLRLACVTAVALCGIFIALDMSATAREGYTLTVLDVGQGQSIAVTSGGATALIDCGTSGYQDAGETAERYVRSLGRGRIDLLVLTHYHADHANGVERLLGTMEVSVLAAPEPEFTESSLDERIIDAAKRAGTEVVYITDITRVDLDGSTVTLIPPLDRVSRRDENERGLTAVVGREGFETVVTGDMPGTVERRLVGSYGDVLPDAECLIVGHHGSRYSTTDELLDELTPELAVISVGENSYGHPTQEVLDRLAERGITVLRTDEDGSVTVTSASTEKNVTDGE